jgi:SAM-dependent methyltransferase
VDAEAWDERYRAADRLWSTTPNTFVADRLAHVEPGVGLDLASGEGRNAVWLAERGWEMVAVDFSSVALDRGRALSDEVEFIAADVFSWEPDRDFDLILIAYLQVEGEALADLVRRARDWLEPEGELFMIGHDLSNLDEGVGGPQVPDLLWDLDLMLGWLGDLRTVEGGIVRRPVEVDGDIAYARDVLIRARRV